MRKVLPLLCAVFALLILVSCAKPADKPLTAAELLDLGEKYLLEMDYEQAVVQFFAVIDVEPMNPRGYTGAAEAHVGLGDTDSAVEILQQGLAKWPDDESIKHMIAALTVVEVEPEDEPEPEPMPEPLSPLEIAETEPWRLFDSPLLANEVTLAGVPFWDCTLEAVQSYYPDGGYRYKDSNGVIRDLDGGTYEGEMGWDTSYSNNEMQYSTRGSRRYAGFKDISEIRGLARGMDIDATLAALGFSSDGIAFVKEVEGATFVMDEEGCSFADVSQYGDGSDDYFVGLIFNGILDNGHMFFNVCIRDGGIRLIEIITE